METLTTAELYDLIYTIMEAGSTQFQYWLAMTFALIGAAHVAGDKIRMPLKLGVAIVYVCATILFVLLYFVAGTDFNAIVDELRSRGLRPNTPYGPYVLIMRFTVWISGTLLALFFLFRKRDDSGA
jgi:hypothetical protein